MKQYAGGIVLASCITATAAAALFSLLQFEIIPPPEIEPPILQKGPPLSASSTLVFDVASGRKLFGKQIHIKRPIASLTKLMTALILEESVKNRERFIEMTARVKEKEDETEKQSAIEIGERITIDDLLKLVLIESSADAARLAPAAAGKQSIDFMRDMNAKARTIGMTRTYFADEIGLRARSVATAQDLAKLLQYINFYHPRLWEISRRNQAIIVTALGNAYNIKNTNPLLGEYPEIVGSKTGFTDEAQGTLIFLYKMRPERMFGIIMLGSNDRFGDAEKIIQYLKDEYLSM